LRALSPGSLADRIFSFINQILQENDQILCKN
jgi:hypothetical protein